MKRSSVSHLNTGVASALDVVGEWWSLLVVSAIRHGTHRFEPMQRELGVARNILSDRLVTLVAAGVVEKREYSSKPMRYEYHLTECGRSLFATLDQLEIWGSTWCEELPYAIAGD